MHATYGMPRLRAELQGVGMVVSRRRSFCVTTDWDTRQRPAPDLVNRGLRPPVSTSVGGGYDLSSHVDGILNMALLTTRKPNFEKEQQTQKKHNRHPLHTPL